jgi:hypothetical protein
LKVRNAMQFQVRSLRSKCLQALPGNKIILG